MGIFCALCAAALASTRYSLFILAKLPMFEPPIAFGLVKLCARSLVYSFPARQRKSLQSSPYPMYDRGYTAFFLLLLMQMKILNGRKMTCGSHVGRKGSDAIPTPCAVLFCGTRHAVPAGARPKAMLGLPGRNVNYYKQEGIRRTLEQKRGENRRRDCVVTKLRCSACDYFVSSMANLNYVSGGRRRRRRSMKQYSQIDMNLN